VKQRVRDRVGGHGSIQHIVYQPVVIMIAYGIGNDTPVVQVQDGAQINLADFRPDENT
jgi:hypothetical protein